jgi:tRNA(Ile2) C34 agmatinyltransferase TiaS
MDEQKSKSNGLFPVPHRPVCPVCGNNEKVIPSIVGGYKCIRCANKFDVEADAQEGVRA